MDRYNAPACCHCLMPSEWVQSGSAATSIGVLNFIDHLVWDTWTCMSGTHIWLRAHFNARNFNEYKYKIAIYVALMSFNIEGEPCTDVIRRTIQIVKIIKYRGGKKQFIDGHKHTYTQLRTCPQTSYGIDTQTRTHTHHTMQTPYRPHSAFYVHLYYLSFR